MPKSLKRLQSLLRGLFRFDLSDPDFGIFRVFRLKRGEMEKLSGEQNPRAVQRASAHVAGKDTAKLKSEVSDLAQKIREEPEVDAILDDGGLEPRFDKAGMGAMLARVKRAPCPPYSSRDGFAGASRKAEGCLRDFDKHWREVFALAHSP
jgi:hypothetical protein